MADAKQPAPKPDSSGTPLSSEIDSMSDYQLKRLTRSNTKRNVGGKKKRFLSQLERVCRRLELLNVSPQAEPDAQNHSLDALPIVNPDGSTFTSQLDHDKERIAPRNPDALQHEQQQQEADDDEIRMPKRTQTPRFAKESPFALSGETQNSEESVSPASSTENDDFDVEPATVGCSHDGAPCSTLTTSFRSVRISTEVTILGYSPRNKQGEPMSLSVSTMRRTEHPTRNGKCFHLRPRRAHENRFPFAMSALEGARRATEVEGGAASAGDFDADRGGRPKLLLRHARVSPRVAPHVEKK